MIFNTLMSLIFAFYILPNLIFAGVEAYYDKS